MAENPNQFSTDRIDHELLQSILDSAVDAIIVIRSNGIIVNVNSAAIDLFGYDVEDFIGSSVNFLMPEPFSSEHDGYLRNYLETGNKKIIGIGREVTGLRSDGDTFPMYLSVGEFEVDGEKYFTGIVHDLGQLKQTEAVATRMGRIIEGATNEIYTFDAKTLRFLSANAGARKNLQYSEPELLAMTPVDIKPNFNEADFRKLIAPLISGKEQVLQFETVHSRKDGTQYHVEVNLQLYRGEKPHMFVAVILDITERRQAEQALHQSQKMDAIGNLTGGIAHDFNNLLTVIIGNLELLEMRLDDEHQRELLTEAQEAADLGSRLTNRLLAFARRSQLEPEIVDMNSVIIGLTDMLQRTLGETVNLNSALSPKLWSVRVDRSQLESAIVNLAVNARDAMPEGGKLLLETANTALTEEYAAREIGLALGDYVRLSVTDSGTGMTTDVAEKAFEPFFTTKEVGRGTGMGLSTIYGFAKQSGGHLTLYSELGIGTTVNLYLPKHAEKPRKTKAAKNHAATLGQGELILVVEDDERVRRLTLARLEQLGYSVLEAENGKTALEILKANADIDLILTDFVMPGGMSGYEVCVQARALRPGIKVLLTSGYAEETVNGDKLTDAGLRILRKPYQQAELAKVISEELAKS